MSRKKDMFLKCRHSYYNLCMAVDFNRNSDFVRAKQLLDSERCSFDEFGNVTHIDGKSVKMINKRRA